MIVKNMDELGEIESLYKEYYGSLCYYALNYVCDMEVAQDIVQDIFVHLIEARPKSSRLFPDEISFIYPLRTQV